jgi:hypothetical protein
METKLKRNIAVQVIKDHNIAKIEVDYSGGGDDGCIDDVRYEDIDENKIDILMEPDVSAEWDDLIYNMISENIEWDWINNEGGYGQMMIDCTKTPWKVTINHSQRVLEDHYYDDIEFSTDNKQHFF